MKSGWNENQLKMVAVVTMVIDHVGYFLLPQVVWLRWIGRLSFPIFAYFIAEGCYYTRNLRRYFGQMAALGLICMGAAAAFAGQIYGNILITFALSVFLVGMLKLNALIGLLAMGPVLYLTMHMEIDYGFVGILIPVACWAVRVLLESRRPKAVRPAQLGALAIGLLILAFQLAPYQWMGLFTIPLLALYNGERGEKNLKWFFYFFYPLHILAIQVIAMIL